MEISERLRQVFENKRVTFKDFCDESGVNYRTLRNYLDGRAPSAEFLVILNKYWGVSTDWLLTGQGQMYYNEKLLRNYLKGNYDSTISADFEYITESDPTEIYNQKNDLSDEEINRRERLARICAFLNDWTANHSPDEQAWLEIDFKQHYKEYADWLDLK